MYSPTFPQFSAEQCIDNMLCKIVIFITVAVVCVSSQCDYGCRFREYTRVKRGRFYSSPPIRFYNTPPMPIPIQGPFSYTPPPVMTDDSPPYPGNRPYKVSKRPPVPSNDGLGDDDISNLVKHLSKQDLDKIIEFAQEKGQSYNKYRDIYHTNEYSRPYSKRESRIVYKGSGPTKYEEPAPYKEGSKFSNFVTEPSYVKVFSAQEGSRPFSFYSRPGQREPLDVESYPPSQRLPNEVESFPFSQDYEIPYPSASFLNQAIKNEDEYVKVFAAQEPQRRPAQIDPENYQSYPVGPSNGDNFLPSEPIGNSQRLVGASVSNNAFFSESNEEAKLPPPVNMRDEEFEVSNTNNVPKVVKAESTSYEVENFGDLPLMDYNSKLHDVSSYHVPHYTVSILTASLCKNTYYNFITV